MEDLRLPKSVKRITVLEFDGSGTGVVVQHTLERKRKKRKKGTKALRPLERLVRKGAKAQESLTATYVRRHQRSNKKKDGWLRDLSVNVARATAKAARKLRPKRLAW